MATTTETSFKTKIIAALGKFRLSLENPDKSNAGSLLTEAFLWDEVEAYAKARSNTAWAELEKQGFIPPKESLEPGEHSLYTTPSFTCSAKVSNPVKRFQVPALAKLLKKKFKVPEPVTTELCEAAKVPTKSTVSFSIAERS